MKRIQFFLLAFFCLMNIAWAWHSNPKADEYAQKAYQSWQAGNLNEALALYTEALKYDPKRPDLLNYLGVIYEELGLSQQAEEKYLTALKIDDSLLSSYFNLGVLYWNRGEVQKSMAYFKKRVELGNPQDPWTMKAQKALNTIKSKQSNDQNNLINQDMNGSNNSQVIKTERIDQSSLDRDVRNLDHALSNQQNMVNTNFHIAQEVNNSQSASQNHLGEGVVVKPYVDMTPAEIMARTQGSKMRVSHPAGNQEMYQSQNDSSSGSEGESKGIIPMIAHGIKNLFK